MNNWKTENFILEVVDSDVRNFDEEKQTNIKSSSRKKGRDREVQLRITTPNYKKRNNKCIIISPGIYGIYQAKAPYSSFFYLIKNFFIDKGYLVCEYNYPGFNEDKVNWNSVLLNERIIARDIVENFVINNYKTIEIINIGYSFGTLVTSASKLNNIEITKREIWISPASWLSTIKSASDFQKLLLSWGAKKEESKICYKNVCANSIEINNVWQDIVHSLDTLNIRDDVFVIVGEKDVNALKWLKENPKISHKKIKYLNHILNIESKKKKGILAKREKVHMKIIKSIWKEVK